MGSVAKNGLQKYLFQLQNHPLRTKAITAGVLTAVSDIVSQKLSGIQKLQIKRLLLKVLLGVGYLGPFGHYLHIVLDKIFKGKKDTKTVAKKVVLEQLTSSPWNNLVFMLYYGLFIEGRPWPHVKSKIKKDFPSVQYASWTAILASSKFYKSPIRTDAIPCHLPKCCGDVLGYFPESASKVNDIKMIEEQSGRKKEEDTPGKLRLNQRSV